MPGSPDFDDRARVLVDALLLDPDVWGTHGEPGATKLRIITAAIAEQLRLVWNARGAADLTAVSASRPPCQTFSESELPKNGCKHCGWTEEAHDNAAAIRALDR